MEEEILHQGPGYTIARTRRPGTLVPYPRVERSDGINHGWVDTRGHPERVELIPEARKSEGLREILLVVANASPLLMSSGCECGAFESDTDQRPRWHVGGFVMLMFPQADRNSDWRQLEQLAIAILGGIQGTPDHHIGFEAIIEPLKVFFDRLDCHALMFKPMGYGDTEAEAWAAFDVAASAVARSISILTRDALDQTRSTA